MRFNRRSDGDVGSPGAVSYVSLLGMTALCVSLTFTILVGGTNSASAQQISKDKIEEMGIEEYKRRVDAGLIEGPDTTVDRQNVPPERSLSLFKVVQETSSGLRVPLDSTFSVVEFDGAGGTGEADPDDPEQRNDDDVTDAVGIGFDFEFYGNTYNDIYINNNGNITFVEAEADFNPAGFPSEEYRMVAPFWADVDTRNNESGTVYRRIDPNQVVITWNQVGYFKKNADKLNTFQVIISNGDGADVPAGKNVCFSYAEMQWTTGDASGGSDGFGGAPATVGVNKGDGSTFALLGRFDQPDDSYDGPGGDTDGVDYLDNRQVCFNTETGLDNLPPTAQNVPTGPISVGEGNTVSGSFEFLSPESGQVTSVSVSGQPPNFESTTAEGNPATIEYTFTPSSEQADSSFTVTFTATDDGDPPQSSTVDLTFLTLEPTLTRTVETPERGSPLDVNVSVSENFDATEAQLFYRRAGAPEFQSTALEQTGTGTYEGTVPGEAVTVSGVEYYALISDGNVTITVPGTDPTSQPRYAPVRVAELEAGVGLEAEQYRMISVPLLLDTTDAFAQLRDDFGGLDRTDWRLLRWNSAQGQCSSEAGSYEEVTIPGGTGDLVPGLAYWLITRDGETQEGEETFDVEAGRSVPAEPIEIDLRPGWTQVANPRSYPIAWSAVSGHESVMDPVAYDPTASDSADFGVAILRPWTGYWVCNPGQSPVQIEVPASEAETAQASAVATKDPSSGAGSLFDEKPSFALALTARLEREEEATLRDVHTVMGVADAGQPGVGLEDAAEPPPIGDHLRLSIVEEETRLAGSLRPAGKDGYTWDLEVSASGLERWPKMVHGKLEVRGSLPAGFERRLMDRDTGRRIPITGETFTVQLTDERPTRDLQLIVGTEAFAKTESETIRPDRTGLRAVYPNPSRGNVSVDYQLKTAQRVQIQIYDVLGRRVRTLVDERRTGGHHEAHWNARSGSGRVASGAYIVRMKTESTSVSRRISIVR